MSFLKGAVYLLNRNRFLKIIIYLIILVVGVSACSSIKKSIYNTEIAIERFRSGLTLKTIDIENQKISYLEGGEGDTVLLVHGYTASKEIWIRFAKILKDQYRVIAIDLPGHGDSTASLNHSYSIHSQVQYLNQIIDKLGLEKIHLVGNSMGGSISLSFTKTFQAKVKTLALFNSGGVTSPQPSEFQKLLKQGKNPFIVKNIDEFNALTDLSMSSPPFFPWPVMSVMYQKYIDRFQINQKIYTDISRELWKSEHVLKTIDVPVLILWGADDRLIDVSCVEIFNKNIPNSTAVIMEKTGHCPMLEKPEEAARHYLDFLQKKNAS
ncbi:MAG: alpha/beta hydrolase [Candidatus Magnetomorum sp.]|nr:alpha/beta hydrolase [Candidatus Magnetomorum sp.]